MRTEGIITKIVGGVMAVIVLLGLVLVAFRAITWPLFWAIIIIGAFTAYLVVPYFKNKGW